MRTEFCLILALAGIAAPAAATNNATYLLTARVPMACSVNYAPSLATDTSSGSLGHLTEYCNAPGGYEVRMYYPAGALRGAVLNINGRAVTIDGTGDTLVDVAPGATVRKFEILTISNKSMHPASVGFAIIPRYL